MHIINEHYHIYNCGAHKEPIFKDVFDYQRFWALLYAANNSAKLHRDWKYYAGWPNFDRKPLVSIFAYCLMPNHFHIGIIELQENGIEKFMHKLSTSYTMYFNIKYGHSGTIFQGRYKYKHVENDDYLRYLIQYIHLNPYGTEEPNMSRYGKLDNIEKAVEYSRKYEYSSYRDYLGETRPQNNILVRQGSTSDGG